MNGATSDPYYSLQEAECPHDALDGITAGPRCLAALMRLQDEIAAKRREIGTMEHNLHDGLCMARELGHTEEAHCYGTYRVVGDEVRLEVDQAYGDECEP